MKKIFHYDFFIRGRPRLSNAVIIVMCSLFCLAALILAIFLAFFSRTVIQFKKPNIILIVADDMGWNDIGFHGSNEIPTPNIDALAYHGAILNRHYTQSVCTPSRSALLTGKYPIRMGMQGGALQNNVRASLPLNLTLLPQYLQEQGYVTNLIGKWHLGLYKNSCTPIERGFDSFLGYYGGWVRYNDSVAASTTSAAFDARRNFEKAGDEFSEKYNTDVYTDEAVRIIKGHDKSKPLFLEVAYTAVHAIFGSKLQVRNFKENEKRFAYIKDPNRRMFAGVLTALDESVGRIIQNLDENNMLENSIVLFISDNGAQTDGGHSSFQNYGSNWPFRGMKGSILEGAVHGAAAIWSPFLLQNVVLSNLMHLTDWLPTFYSAAGGDELSDIDGISHWAYLTGADTEEPRSQVLVNIDENLGAAALIVGDWKLVKSRNCSLNYSGASGRDVSLVYDMDAVVSSPTHAALSKYDQKPVHKDEMLRSRKAATIDSLCKDRLNPFNENINNYTLPCFETSCLFNLKNDACEFIDLSQNFTKIMKEMNQILRTFEAQVVKQWIKKQDPMSDPKYFDNYITPWVR